MTDPLSGKETVQKTFTYIESICKEARKALTLEFNKNHKGAKFSTVSTLLREATLDWFSRRDPNLTLTHDSTDDSRLGQVSITFKGETKKVNLKIRLNANFSLTTQVRDAPCFLRDINLTIDRRDFS